MLRILAWAIFYITKIILAIIPASLMALWAIPYAAMERGYTGAIGGEWLLIILTFLFSYHQVTKKANEWLYGKEDNNV